MPMSDNAISSEKDPSVPSHVKNISTTDISNWNGKANDNAVVHLTGNETVAGVKNFTDNQTGANISQLNLGTCTTAQATTLKEVTLEGYVPKQGDTFKVLMTNASVANATIRFNGGTTYTIRNATSATSTSSWGANSICEFLLDGTYAFLVSVKPANSTTQPTFYGNASSASTSTSATYSTGGIISVKTLSDNNTNTDKWAYFGYFTLTYNSTYNRGMSINHCFLFTEYSRLNSDVSVNDLEAFQVQVKVNLREVISSSLFNSAVPNIAINITGKTNLTSSDFCALVYSTSISAKVIRLYVKLKTPNKHYGFLPICYGNNAYSSTGAISTSYISWTSASVQALISSLPTPAQGAPVFATVYPNYGSNTGDETGTTIKVKFATEERWFTHNIEITRDLIRQYSDIKDHSKIPEAEVFNLANDNSNFAVLLPIPLGMTVGKQELKFYADDLDISSYIYESARPFMAGRNQCPLSTDWVFAFRVDSPYNENATYILRITDKRIPIEPENFEGVPFSKELSDPVMYAPDADNILFPPLPYPYVYEVWRWIRNKGGKDPLTNKKQYYLSVMKYYKEAFGRFRLFCRGDFKERTLQEITSRLDTGIDSLRIGIEQQEHPRLVPFKIAIFNTLTGARTVFSQCYGWVQTGMTKNDRGFRRILDK